MNKELEALENIFDFIKSECVEDEYNEDYHIIETALKRIPILEKEIEDTHEAYNMAIEKHIKDENEYIEWVQEGGYDKSKVEVLEIIRDNFDLWIETKYKATLQFLLIRSLTQGDYEKLINYFGEPKE